MFSVMFVCLFTDEVPCDDYPWGIGPHRIGTLHPWTWDFNVQRHPCSWPTCTGTVFPRIQSLLHGRQAGSSHPTVKLSCSCSLRCRCTFCDSIVGMWFSMRCSWIKLRTVKWDAELFTQIGHVRDPCKRWPHLLLYRSTTDTQRQCYITCC